jgi:hypothetical protein
VLRLRVSTTKATKSWPVYRPWAPAKNSWYPLYILRSSIDSIFKERKP